MSPTTELDESQVQFDEADLIQSICRESFYEFVREFWDTIIEEEPQWNWHIKFLCLELQTMAERVFRNEPREYDLITNISPGTTKSTIFSIMFPAWVWTRMPSARFITPSHDHNLALINSTKSRDIITHERYQAFRFKKNAKGRWEPSTDPEAVPLMLRGDQNAKGYYGNMAKGTRFAIGSLGSVIGRHAHFVIVDDPIDPEGTHSEPDLKRVNRWMRETLPSRKVNKEVAPTILVMQRLHENDPTGDMLERASGSTHLKVKHICLPAKLADNVKPAKCRAKYVDGFMDPVRLNQKVLDAALADLGQYGYAGQYDQNPAPPSGGMFKVDKVNIGQPPPIHKFIRVVRYWDKAGTSAKDNAGAAYTVGLKMGLIIENNQKHWWILDVLRGQWDSGTRETLIKQTAAADGPNVILATEQEPGSGGKESAENTVNNNAGSRVRIDRPVGDKVKRADPFSVQVNWGYVHVPAGAAWWPTYRDELRLFPFSKFKDQTDASSGAFSVVNRQRVGAL